MRKSLKHAAEGPCDLYRVFISYEPYALADTSTVMYTIQPGQNQDMHVIELHWTVGQSRRRGVLEQVRPLP